MPADGQLAVEVVKEEAKQGGAQGAALPDPNLGSASGSRPAADLHAHGTSPI